MISYMTHVKLSYKLVSYDLSRHGVFFFSFSCSLKLSSKLHSTFINVNPQPSLFFNCLFFKNSGISARQMNQRELVTFSERIGSAKTNSDNRNNNKSFTFFHRYSCVGCCLNAPHAK